MNCKQCNKHNENLTFPEDYYLFVYTRDTEPNILLGSKYITYERICFDCTFCNSQNKCKKSTGDSNKLIIVQENENDHIRFRQSVRNCEH